MREIELTKGKVALVDDNDYDWITQWKWSARFDEGTKSYYAVRQQKYIGNNGRPKYKTIYMAREIMNTPPNLICDHFNHNTLDNQKGNLRNITKMQNNQNVRGARVHNKSTGILGVRPHGKGFISNIYINGVREWSTTYLNIEDAIAWRKAMEIKYYISKPAQVLDNL